MTILQDDIDIFMSRAQQKIGEVMWKVAEDSHESSVRMYDEDLIDDLMIAISIFSSCDHHLTMRQAEFIIHYMTGVGNLNDYPYFDFTGLSIKYNVILGMGSSVSASSFNSLFGSPYDNAQLNSVLTSLQAQINNRALIGHGHVESDISDLDKYTQAQVDTLLAGKANVVHNHTESDIPDLDKYDQATIDLMMNAKANVNDDRLGTKNIDETNIGDLKIQVYRTGPDNLVYMSLEELQQAITGAQNNTFGDEFDDTYG